MIFAILTALCWAFSGFASSRISRHYGSAAANAMRLCTAVPLLVLISFSLGYALRVSWAPWFWAAGFLHLAVGDVPLFAAYRRLGPRLGALMVCSLAPPVALITEWVVLGTMVSGFELLCIAGILISVAMAVAPRDRGHLSPREVRRGVWAGVLGSLGQGTSAAMNRIAYAQAGEAALETAWVPTFHRVAAGALGVLLWIGILQLAGKRPLQRPGELIPHKRVGGHPLAWLGVSACLGPVLGVMLLMRAFEHTPAALVQAVLSTLPVFMMPVAWAFDGVVPSRRSALAGIVAVGWTVLLVLS